MLQHSRGCYLKVRRRRGRVRPALGPVSRQQRLTSPPYALGTSERKPEIAISKEKVPFRHGVCVSLDTTFAIVNLNVTLNQSDFV